MKQKKIITRRKFLKKTVGTIAATSTFPYIVPSSALGKAGTITPSNRINVGCIGAGKQGSYVMSNFLSQENAQVVAVCDVRDQHAEAAKELIDNKYQSKDCDIYKDFRELLGRDDIDAVLIATPDHWHVLCAIEAAKAKKDIYLEKPMGLSIAEDQALRQACYNHKSIFQFGTQQRSDSNFRFVCELVRNGQIGKLHTINVWSPASTAGGSTLPTAVPQGLDYDMWVGPASYSPYTENRCAYREKTWWFNSNFALGFIAGWGIHPLDIALWGGDKLTQGLVDVQGKGTFPKEGACDTATKWDITFQYPVSKVKMQFTGDPPPSEWLKRYKTVNPSHGTAFEGTDGWVHVDRSGINAYPKSLLESKFSPNEIHLYRSNNHVGNFLDCIKSRKQTICPIDEAVRSDIVCHIADIAIRLEEKLKWDPQKEIFINNDSANRRLKKAMRSPWHL